MGNDYPYQLAEKTESPAEVKVAQGETSAAVAGAVAAADQAAAMAAASSTEVNLEVATVEQIKQIIEESQSVTDDNKNIVIVPALEVKAEEYRVDGDNTTMTLDIKASYTSYETDKSITAAAEVKTNAGDAEKVKEIGSGKLNTEGTAVDVKVAVANDFAGAMGASTTTSVTIFVRHSHNGKNFEYTASLAYDGVSSKYFVSFTNPNGFSPFTLSKTSSAVASIGGFGLSRPEYQRFLTGLSLFTVINGMTERTGTGGHPSVKTDIRMDHELANLLKQWISD